MSKFVSLKLSNESHYWLVDFERGVVSIASEPVDGVREETSGTRISGVDIAIVSEMRDDAFSGKFDK
jgi:hypothetical protein